MAKVKVFVHAANTDTDADARAMILARRLTKNYLAFQRTWTVWISVRSQVNNCDSYWYLGCKVLYFQVNEV